MSDLFNDVNKFIAGQQTSRDLRKDGAKTPPNFPGESALDRKGNLVLGVATNNPPSIPVSDDEHPIVSPFSLDASGRIRIALPLNLKVTGTIIVGTQTQTVTLTVSF